MFEYRTKQRHLKVECRRVFTHVTSRDTKISQSYDTFAVSIKTVTNVALKKAICNVETIIAPGVN